MDFWYELFTALDSKESYLVLFWMISAAFLGFLIGFFIRGGSVRKWKKRYKKKESELVALQADHTVVKEKVALQEADLKKAEVEVEEWGSKFRLLEQNQLQLQNELAVSKDQYQILQQKHEDLQTENQALLSQVERLKLQITEQPTDALAVSSDSKVGPEVLKELESLRTEHSTTKDQLTKLAERLDMLEEENANLKDDLTGIQAVSGQMAAPASRSIAGENMEADALTLALIEEKIVALEEENSNLKEELAYIQGTTNEAIAPIERKIVVPAPGIKEEESELDDVLIAPDKQSVEARAAFRAAIGSKIPAASPTQKDDLKKITGIGPFIEQKLNELGVFTYDQIGQLDEELIGTLTEAIQFFPGRIQRDDWVGQAQKLHTLKQADPQAFVEVVRPSDPQDLKIVEGIGPKIEQLLKSSGIQNWKDLAEAEVPRLREILQEAGSRYRIHNPTTWPDQAKLAFLGEWEKLEEFQSYLNGGKNLNFKG